MAPLSLDFRARIVAAYEAGEGTYVEIAERFSVSKQVVAKLVRQYRTTGSLESGVHRRGRKPLFNSGQLAGLARHIADFPDATVLERQRALNLPGTEVTVWTACKRLGARFKKSRCVQQNKNGQM
jgi:transposase